jgi:hypothetical protein
MDPEKQEWHRIRRTPLRFSSQFAKRKEQRLCWKVRIVRSWDYGDSRTGRLAIAFVVVFFGLVCDVRDRGIFRGRFRGVGVGRLVFRFHELRQFVFCIVVFFDVVEIVHPTSELGRDWSLGRAFLLLIGFLRTFAFWRSRRTEVASAAARTGAFAGSAGARPAKSAWARTTKPASRSWSAKSAASWTRTEAPSAWSGRTRGIAPRARSAWSTRATRWSGPAIVSCSRFADGKRAAHEQLTVELPDRGFGRFAIGVLDERKATGAPGFAIERSHDLRGLADLREMHSQVIFGGLIGEITYE